MAEQSILSAPPKSTTSAAQLVAEKAIGGAERKKEANPLSTQMKLSMGSPNDLFEREADSVADTIMRMPETSFMQRKCSHCHQEDSLPTPITTATAPFIQRKLQVTNDAPANMPANDSAATIPFAGKTAHFNTIIQNLSPTFTVNGTSGEVGPGQVPAALSASSHPLGGCGLNILVNGASEWKIKMSQLLGPHTDGNGHEVVLPAPNSDLQFGNFKTGEDRTTLNDTQIAGHELIGHAAQIEIGIHNQGDEDREAFNHHDPTVRVQNALSHEQGIPGSEDRGLAASGRHRGESYGQVEVNGFGFNSNTVASLPANEQNKITLMADFIKTNNTWADVIGHSDNVGTEGAKQMVSQNRADAVKNRLVALGVTTFMTKHIGTYDYINRPRFTAVKGVSDTEPPSSSDPAAARRVQIFAPNHPAGTENPPADIPALGPAVPGANLAAEKASADPCHRLLANTAFP